MHCVRANFCCRFAVLIFALSCPYDTPTPVQTQKRCVLSGVFFSCVFPSLFVLVLLFLACPFLSVVSLVWRCLVAAAPGCCVLLCARSLGLLSGAVFPPVLVLLLLPSLSRGWLAVWCGFVLARVLCLALSGLSLCLLCADSFLLGVRPPFLLIDWRSLFPKNIMPSQFFISISSRILLLIQISKSIKLHIQKYLESIEY